MTETAKWYEKAGSCGDVVVSTRVGAVSSCRAYASPRGQPLPSTVQRPSSCRARSRQPFGQTMQTSRRSKPSISRSLPSQPVP